MRIRLTLKPAAGNSVIPVNYQYYISSFIYHTIRSSDSDYSRWLHDCGFMSGNKSFKFFTFSLLNIPSMQIENNHIRILSERVSFIISMLSLESLNHLIIGIFDNCRLYLKNTHFRILFAEKIPDPVFKNEMTFKTISPIIVSRKTVYNGKQSEYYIKPTEEDFTDFLKKNLEEKYITYCTHLGIKITDHGVDELNVLESGKSKLITIREGTRNETKVKAFPVKFRIKGNKDILKIAYESGAGKLCSQGFGCLAVAN
jgi:CRISPR-associated endoribonuclease Cas6